MSFLIPYSFFLAVLLNNDPLFLFPNFLYYFVLESWVSVIQRRRENLGLYLQVEKAITLCWTGVVFLAILPFLDP